VPVNGRWVSVTYKADERGHTVTVGRSPVPMRVEVMGREKIKVL
jgi:hypothetical protein